MAMLEINHLQKKFGTTEVLRDVSLSVSKGDVVAILGPSGSGKTTLLRCVNFLERADAGELLFDDEKFDLNRASHRDIARIRQKTAFVFQNYNLFRNKTALQNVTEGLIVARKMKKADAEAIGRKLLDKVGLSDRCDHYPAQLHQRPHSAQAAGGHGERHQRVLRHSGCAEGFKEDGKQLIRQQGKLLHAETAGSSVRHGNAHLRAENGV